MEIKTFLNQEDKELKIAPIGRLDSVTSKDFSDCIEEKFTGDIEKLVIDFTEVDFISSKGLRVIVTTYKNLGERKMVICGANPAVMEVFKFSGLLKVIDVK